VTEAGVLVYGLSKTTGPCERIVACRHYPFRVRPKVPDYTLAVYQQGRRRRRLTHS
jgi:hypothetical protein